MFESNCKKKKVQFFESFSTKKFNFFGSYRKSSVLWVIKKVQLLESFWKKVEFLKSYEKKFNSMIFIQKNQFFESYSKSNIFESCSKKEINSESVITKKKKKTGSILRVIVKKGWNSSSNVQKKRFIFESHLKTTVLSVTFLKNLWVIPKKHQFLESCSKKKGWILWVIFFWRVNMLWVVILVKKKKVQFFESNSKKSGFNSLSNVEEKGSISMSYV